MLITLVQDVKIASIVTVLRMKFSVKWVSGSAQKSPTSVVDKCNVASAQTTLLNFAIVSISFLD